MQNNYFVFSENTNNSVAKATLNYVGSSFTTIIFCALFSVPRAVDVFIGSITYVIITGILNRKTNCS